MSNGQTDNPSNPNHHQKIVKTILAAALILLASYMPILSHPARAASAPTFTFTAAGDYGGIISGYKGYAVAQKIATVNPSFHIALGDLGYNDQNPSNWCNGFKTLYPGTSGGATRPSYPA